MRARMLTALVLGAVLGVPVVLAPPARALEVQSWIVTLDGSADPEVQAPALAASVGGAVEHVFSAVLGGFSFLGTDTQAGLLAGSAGVESVVADGPVQLAEGAAQAVPSGVARVSASPAQRAGATGHGSTVAVIDSGIDLLHPDLSPNLHPSLGANCMEPLLPPQDDNSHGTHVAGTIAAVDDSVGVVGVAPRATLVPVKAFDAAGNSTWSKVICGIDYVAAHSAEIDVANMSFGDLSNESTACDGVTTSDIDALRQAVCDLTDAGVVAVAAAGNNMVDSSGFVPAAFPETITVSALSDTDGQAGGLGGCVFFGAICDDGFASLFSNYGARIDVMAPGFEILSTLPGGLYGVKDGTSMAAPHVSGAVALMLEADRSLSASTVRDMLQRSGECPDGSVAGSDTDCTGQGTWALDPDSEPEPLLHAARAAQMATGAGAPTIGIVHPSEGEALAGEVVVAAIADDDKDSAGTLATALRVDGGSWIPMAWNSATGRYELGGSTHPLANGSHTLVASATDSGGRTTISTPVTFLVANGMHVADLDPSSNMTKRSWTARVTVTVHDETSGLVSGAVVSYAWSDGASGTGTCTTSKKGTCSVASSALPLLTSSATFTVTGVGHSTQTYTAGLNHDPDGDSNGTSITVTRA